ncbi:hypothetical protein GCM10009864_18010 [Streptomyces lunalinharesii]|uniref:Uncharacterized protein n=1 Tax=Streptomyces lunalinharesii TaxID=333384 RepID=A0ABN3RIH0_9ACTN
MVGRGDGMGICLLSLGPVVENSRRWAGSAGVRRQRPGPSDGRARQRVTRGRVPGAPPTVPATAPPRTKGRPAPPVAHSGQGRLCGWVAGSMLEVLNRAG